MLLKNRWLGLSLAPFGFRQGIVIKIFPKTISGIVISLQIIKN